MDSQTKSLIKTIQKAPTTAARPTFQVSFMESSDEKEWDAFLENDPGKLPTLLSAWKHILEKTYGYSCYFLIARNESEICGIMPLYEVKSKIFGHRLETLPGAMCVHSPEAANALISAADSLAQNLEVENLILRDSRVDWTTTVPNHNMRKLELHRGVIHDIKPNEEEAWKHLSSSYRKRTRLRQSDEKLQITVSTSGIEEFHATILTFTHQVSTPCYSLAFIHNVTEFLPDKYHLVNITYDGKVAASFFNLMLGDTIFGIWGTSLHEFRKINPSNKGVWATIKWGAQHDFTKLDMGRSAFPSPQYEFKSQILDTDYPIYQIYRFYHGEEPLYLIAHQTEKDSGPVSLVRKLWPYLPRPVVGFLGPQIRKHIPFG